MYFPQDKYQTRKMASAQQISLSQAMQVVKPNAEDAGPELGEKSASGCLAHFTTESFPYEKMNYAAIDYRRVSIIIL